MPPPRWSPSVYGPTCWRGGFYVQGITSAILFALGMFVLGFCDDLFDLSPLFRFVVQFAHAHYVSGMHGACYRVLHGQGMNGPGCRGSWWGYSGVSGC